ncbi:MAG: flippase-like domain-containing protein [Gemmataceae bacterium]|nr:flippase-like domain-containing protein [Gemmataceae bacterium]
MNRLLRILVSAALLTYLGWRTDWSSVRDAFARLRWEYWLAAVGVLLAAQCASAVRWKHFADSMRFRHSIGRLTGFYLIGTYFNLLLPTSVGGDVVRAWYLDGRSGRRWAALGCVLLDRLNGLAVLVALACLAATFAPLAIPAWIPWCAWGLAAGGALGLLSLPVLARIARLSPMRREQLQTLWRFLRSPRLLARATLLSLIVQAANVLAVWCVGLSIHAPIDAAYYWVFVPLISLLTLLPISLNGMGVREGAAVLFLAPFGIADGTAVTLAFLWFCVTVAVSLVGGVVYLAGGHAKPDAASTPQWGEHPGLPSPCSTLEASNESVDHHPDQGRTGQYSKAA